MVGCFPPFFQSLKLQHWEVFLSEHFLFLPLSVSSASSCHLSHLLPSSVCRSLLALSAEDCDAAGIILLRRSPEEVLMLSGGSLPSRAWRLFHERGKSERPPLAVAGGNKWQVAVLLLFQVPRWILALWLKRQGCLTRTA